MPGPGSAGRRSAARRRGSFIFSRKIHATAAGSTAASARRIPSTSVVIPGAEPAFAARLSPPPQPLVHARLEPAGPGKGAQPARRRADLRSRRRGRPGGQGRGAVGRRGSARRRRLRPARAGAAGQCARYSVGSGRSRRRGRDADRCGAVAKGRERRPGSARGIGARCGWRVIDPRDLVHVGDAARRPRGRRDCRGEPAACRAGRRHLRSDQGSARAAHTRPPAAAACARPHICSPRAPMGSRLSTASTSISPTTRGSPSPAGRAARSVSTARP